MTQKSIREGELRERRNRVHIKGKCTCCDNLARIAEIEYKSLLQTIESEIEQKAHFSKLAGSRYDGYINSKDVLAIISKYKEIK